MLFQSTIDAPIQRTSIIVVGVGAFGIRMQPAAWVRDRTIEPCGRAGTRARNIGTIRPELTWSSSESCVDPL